MLSEEDASNCDAIIIDSDNCSSQYNSGLHFYHLQEIANNYDCTVIRTYGIPGHGKGEVDHVGGTAKVTIRRMAAAGRTFLDASDIVEALIEKYANSSTTKYIIKEISSKDLEFARKEARSLKISTVDGNSSLRVIVFQAGRTTFQGAKRLCICTECKEDHGSCSNYRGYQF